MFDRIDRFDPDKLISGVNALDSGAVIALRRSESNNDPAWVRRQAAAIAALRARCGAMTDEAAIYDLVRPTKSSHSHRTPTGDIHGDGTTSMKCGNWRAPNGLGAVTCVVRPTRRPGRRLIQTFCKTAPSTSRWASPPRDIGSSPSHQ